MCFAACTACDMLGCVTCSILQNVYRCLPSLMGSANTEENL